MKYCQSKFEVDYYDYKYHKSRKTVFSILAPAKINWFLRVIGRRDDGMHFIESAISFLSMCDFIRVDYTNSSRDEEIFLGPFSKDVNIKGLTSIGRVLKSLRELGFLSSNRFFRISVFKNIPAGSGLGGGSSNAAALILGFIQSGLIDINDKEKVDIALQVGTDTVVCLQKNSVIVGGVGDKTREFIHSDRPFVLLVLPKRRILSQEAYSKLGTEFSDTLDSMPSSIVEAVRIENDLIKALTGDDKEEILEIMREMTRMPGAVGVSMTGSGSTCFSIYHSYNLALSAVLFFKRRGYYVFLEQIL